MKAQYIYKSAFGDSLLTITGKSASRGRDSVHNLRWERTRYIDRISKLNILVQNLRRAKAVMQNHARKECARMLAEISRLNAEALEARRDSDIALKIAERDKQDLLDKVESLTEENRKWRDIAERCFASAMKNAVTLANGRKGKRGE